MRWNCVPRVAYLPSTRWLVAGGNARTSLVIQSESDGESMARYKTDDGEILNTEKATNSYREDTVSNGSNMISCATGSQWVHETLFRSSKGNYWIETTCQWGNVMPSGYMISNNKAASWLAMNGHDIPNELEAELESIEE